MYIPLFAIIYITITLKVNPGGYHWQWIIIYVTDDFQAIARINQYNAFEANLHH